LLPTARNGLIDDEGQKALETVRLPERLAGEDPIELFYYLDTDVFGELGRGAL
jgi:hypothetical protein